MLQSTVYSIQYNKPEITAYKTPSEVFSLIACWSSASSLLSLSGVSLLPQDHHVSRRPHWASPGPQFGIITAASDRVTSRLQPEWARQKHLILRKKLWEKEKRRRRKKRKRWRRNNSTTMMTKKERNINDINKYGIIISYEN